MKFGGGELIIILILALIVFGPSRLPELGEALGETVNSFRTHANKKLDEADDKVEE